jgi:hypothetical protein
MWIREHNVMITIDKGRRPATCLSDLEEEMRVKLLGEPKPLKHFFNRSSPPLASPPQRSSSHFLSSPFPDDNAYPPTLYHLSPLVFDSISGKYLCLLSDDIPQPHPMYLPETYDVLVACEEGLRAEG